MTQYTFTKCKCGDKGCNKYRCDQSWAEGMFEEEQALELSTFHTLQAENEKLRSALKDLFDATRPSYHDCLDNGEPECHFCIAERALTQTTED